MQVLSSRDYVLRAMGAAEIAEGCTRADLRRSFFELSEHWLDRARDAEDAPGDEGREAPRA